MKKAISEFPRALYQNEVRWSAFDMQMIFHSHANKTHFHKKDCAVGIILKMKVFGTRKWPIIFKEVLVWSEKRFFGFKCNRTHCGIAHILPILQTNSYDVQIFPVTTIHRLPPSNYVNVCNFRCLLDWIEFIWMWFKKSLSRFPLKMWGDKVACDR